MRFVSFSPFSRRSIPEATLVMTGLITLELRRLTSTFSKCTARIQCFGTLFYT